MTILEDGVELAEVRTELDYVATKPNGPLCPTTCRVSNLTVPLP